MQTLSTINTPALVLDRSIAARNMARMQGHLAGVAPGVLFRPHLKTAKSIAVADMLFDGARLPITVSTLKEAELFGAAGFTDILYAVGLSPQKIAPVQALREQGINLTVVTDNVAMATAVRDAAPDGALPTLIELDVDGHRAGVGFDDGAALIARAAALGPNCAGVMTHAGGSYDLDTPEALRAMAAQERDAVLACAAALRAAGLPCERVSVGSTPTALSATGLDGVTEVRAGVYVFFDLVMAGIGVCGQQDIALSVLTSVIGHQPAKGWIIVDAGWMAMSRDRGTAKQKVDHGYGAVCAVDGEPEPALWMGAANQEHGIVSMRDGSCPDDLVQRYPIGTLLRVQPNHACATAAQYDAYRVVEGDAIIDTWPRFSGW